MPVIRQLGEHIHSAEYAIEWLGCHRHRPATLCPRSDVAEASGSNALIKTNRTLFIEPNSLQTRSAEMHNTAIPAGSNHRDLKGGRRRWVSIRLGPESRNNEIGDTALPYLEAGIFGRTERATETVFRSGEEDGSYSMSNQSGGLHPRPCPAHRAGLQRVELDMRRIAIAIAGSAP
jgi:hypothetical protein